jgi:hypothetical protein
VDEKVLYSTSFFIAIISVLSKIGNLKAVFINLRKRFGMTSSLFLHSPHDAQRMPFTALLLILGLHIGKSFHQEPP